MGETRKKIKMRIPAQYFPVLVKMVIIKLSDENEGREGGNENFLRPEKLQNHLGKCFVCVFIF